MRKRVASVWFPRLPSDRVLRARTLEAATSNRPFALVQHAKNTDRIYCLNQAAEAQGLHRGMGLSDARAYCPELSSAAANPQEDARFFHLPGGANDTALGWGWMGGMVWS